MPERIPEQITLEELRGRLQRRTEKFTPDHIAGIQTRLQILGTDKGPAIFNPANYQLLNKLRATMRLGRAQEKIAEVLPQKSRLVREGVENALNAIEAYQGINVLKTKGYLQGVDLQEVASTVVEVVGKVYKGTIIFPESQPIQQPQQGPIEAGLSKPASVSAFRQKVLQNSLDRFRAGGNPQQILNMISLAANGLTEDEILAQVSFGASDQSNQLTATNAKINDKIKNDGIRIISQKGPDGLLRYVIVSLDQAPPRPKRKKKDQTE